MMHSDDWKQRELDPLQKPIAEQALDASVNARVTLMAGFTTVRDVGSHDYLDVGLRNAIRNGDVPGPRMLVSVHAIGATGGHCDDTAGFREGLFGQKPDPPKASSTAPIKRATPFVSCTNTAPTSSRPAPAAAFSLPPTTWTRRNSRKKNSTPSLMKRTRCGSKSPRTATAPKPPSAPSAPASIPSSTELFSTTKLST